MTDTDTNTIQKEALTILIEAGTPPSDTLLETILELAANTNDYVLYQANRYSPEDGFPSQLTTSQLLEKLQPKRSDFSSFTNVEQLVAKTLFHRPDLTDSQLFSQGNQDLFAHYDLWRSACKNAIEKKSGGELLNLLLAAKTPKPVLKFASATLTDPKLRKAQELSASEVGRLLSLNRENPRLCDASLADNVVTAFLQDKKVPYLFATLVTSPYCCLRHVAGKQLAVLLSRPGDQLDLKVFSRTCREVYRRCVKSDDSNFHYASCPVLRIWFAKQCDASLLRAYKKRTSVGEIKTILAIELAKRPAVNLKTLMEIESANPHLSSHGPAIDVFTVAYQERLKHLTTEQIMTIRRENPRLRLLEIATLKALSQHPHRAQLYEWATSD